MFAKKQLDFLAVGDITTDAFIRLSDAWIETDNPKREQELCMKFADKIPYEFVEVIRAVGNAPNGAVSAARLGLAIGLITNMGDDQNGKECLAVLENEHIDTGYVKIHKGTRTNYHYVLWYESERTILIKHEAYEYHLPEIYPAPRWLYLSSFRGTPEYHAEIGSYLEQHPDVKLAFQPGKFEINLGAAKLANFYKRAEVFVCNKEEAEKILRPHADIDGVPTALSQTADIANSAGGKSHNGQVNFGIGTIKTLLSGIGNLGPKMVLITDGPKGAYYCDGKDSYFMPPYPDPKPPYERTGAGDAYASTFTAALALGKTAEEALQWSGINSMSVVQEIGAQRGLIPQGKIEEWLKKAPEDYKLKRL